MFSTNNMYLICIAALFDEPVIQKSDELTEKHVADAVIYLKTACQTAQHIGKMVYLDAQGFKVTAERLQVVLNREWLTSDVSTKKSIYVVRFVL